MTPLEKTIDTIIEERISSLSRFEKELPVIKLLREYFENLDKEEEAFSGYGGEKDRTMYNKATQHCLNLLREYTKKGI